MERPRVGLEDGRQSDCPHGYTSLAQATQPLSAQPATWQLSECKGVYFTQNTDISCEFLADKWAPDAVVEAVTAARRWKQVTETPLEPSLLPIILTIQELHARSCGCLICACVLAKFSVPIRAINDFPLISLSLTPNTSPTSTLQ